MIYVHWAFLAIYVVVIIIVMVRVLMDNRQPAKTMAWMLVLTFIPMLGIILYFFFGQTTRKERKIWQYSMDQLTKHSMLEFVEQKRLHLPIEYRELIKLFMNQNWALPFKNNETEIYTSGYEFFPSLLMEIGKAEHHIHLDTFIIASDPLGQIVADTLIDKARQGVEVRVIYDDVGSWKTKNRFFERMRAEGIEVYPFMPVRFPVFTSKVNYRNHRKICVIDGEVGFIGGMNVAKRYIKGIKKLAWRDTHVKITGAAVYGLQRAFLVDWFFVSRELITDHVYYPASKVAENDSLIQIVTSSPTSLWPEIEQGYVRVLTSAKRYVYMETPYFLPTDPILFAMRTAALSGVDVRLMIPYETDTKIVEWASRTYVLATVKAGVKVYLYKAGFNHSKLLVADDSIATIGSTNVDFRSFENDFEANAFFYDKKIALEVKDIFLKDQEACVSLENVRNLTHRSFLQRLWESIIRLLSPLL
ncbi:cardiolipin synthase [Prevotella melaninogenica]|uniref:cardiolipin synthase n=1 Tax=Prevotella TaxID=838 RepID=UPI0003AD3E2E|nr:MULTISPECIES: cardiolipin synthase [Prevotella]ERJ78994.1 putative cardiolipin synthetase [Prevotella sp. F0091]QUB73960.1 cardiolipin synthase [Prevotella melaninogenica]